MSTCSFALILACALPVAAGSLPADMTVPAAPTAPIRIASWIPDQILPAQVTEDVIADDGSIVIPGGAFAEIALRHTGDQRVSLTLESVTVNGRRYEIRASGPTYDLAGAQHEDDLAPVGSFLGKGTQRVQPSGGVLVVPSGALLPFQLQRRLLTAIPRDRSGTASVRQSRNTTANFGRVGDLE